MPTSSPFTAPAAVTFIATAELDRLKAIEKAARAFAATEGDISHAPALSAALAIPPVPRPPDPRAALEKAAGEALAKTTVFRSLARYVVALAENGLREWLHATGSPRAVRRTRKKAGARLAHALREAIGAREVEAVFPQRGSLDSYGIELEMTHRAVRWLEMHEVRLYEVSLALPEDQKLCPDWEAKMVTENRGAIMRYPIHVDGIGLSDVSPVGRSALRHKPGSWVSVRPCGDEHAGKTYLGIYLGELATQAIASWHPRTRVLTVGLGMHNPAIWTPALGRIVWGMESFWGEIADPAALRQITDADIDGQFYIQALKAMAGGTGKA